MIFGTSDVLRYQCTPNDHHSLVLLYGWTVTQTLVKYKFSESFIIVDYDSLFTNVKKVKVSQI